MYVLSLWRDSKTKLNFPGSLTNDDAYFQNGYLQANLFVIKSIRNSKSTRHGNPIGRYNVSNIGNLINVGLPGFTMEARNYVNGESW